jgi:hypothetical protein
MRTSTKIVFLALLMVSAGITKIQAREEYSRVIRKEYTVNPDAQLIISNLYGKVHCNNWDKPLVSFEIVLRVEASNEQAAQKLMDRIIIAMSGSPTLVDVRTTLEKEGFSGHSMVNVDYTINMPASVNLDLTNKFGDIYINELNGKGKINLSYGNMEVNKLGNSDNLLDIKFSKANIKSIQGAVVLLKYSELELDYAGSLRLDSKYSDLTANKIISLTGNLEGGKLDMENSTAVDSKSKFSDLDITRIEKNLTLDIQYGNCEVSEMPADFANISIHNKYADISIGLPEGANYVLEAELKFCDLDFPEEKANFSQKITGNTSKSYKAVVGKDTNPPGRIKVISEYGNISLE